MDQPEMAVGHTADTNGSLSQNICAPQLEDDPDEKRENEGQPKSSKADLNRQPSTGEDERVCSPEEASENCPLLGTPSSNESIVPFQDCDRVREPSQKRLPSNEDDHTGTKANALPSAKGGVFENVVYGNNNNNSPVPTAKIIPFGTGNGEPFKTMSPSPTASESSTFVPLLRNCMRSNLATPPMSKRGKKKKQESGIINVLAAQTLKIASINGLGELDKLENDLEEEIRYDNRSPAKTTFGRLRQEGHHRLHSKFVLFVVVALNIIDTIIVMAELSLDFHHVSLLIRTKQDMIDDFRYNLAEEYSPLLNKYKDAKDYEIFQLVLDSYISWVPHLVDYPRANLTDIAAQCLDYVTTAAEGNNQSFSSYVTSVPQSHWSDDQPLSKCFPAIADIMRPGNESSSAFESKYVMTKFDKVDHTLIDVAHKLHYISVSILAVLVIILILKMICSGKRFFRSRMQVFDGIVIIISFTIDLVFIEGVTIFQMDEFVLILTFLLPWRILRVLNSLIVAVLDKQRLNLKIIYTQKKKITRNLSEVNNKVEVLQRQIQVLQGLCSSRGIHDGDVRKILGTEKHEKKGGHHGGGLASMMALGKLAFQAADALAPMPSEFGSKNVSTPTTPVLLSPFAFGGSPLMGSTDSKSTPPSSAPTTPEANGSRKTPAVAKTTAVSNGTGESFNGKAASTATQSQDIENRPTSEVLVAENQGRMANGFLRVPQDNINKIHSMDTDSIRIESEDLKEHEGNDDNKSGGGNITTSQATLHSSPPSALAGSEPSNSEDSASPDNVAIDIEDLSDKQIATTTNSPSPDSPPVSREEVGSTPGDGQVNSTDASSRL